MTTPFLRINGKDDVLVVRQSEVESIYFNKEKLQIDVYLGGTDTVDGIRQETYYTLDISEGYTKRDFVSDLHTMLS